MCARGRRRVWYHGAGMAGHRPLQAGRAALPSLRASKWNWHWKEKATALFP